MLLKELLLAEGWFSKKKNAPTRTSLTDEERELIERIFPDTNVMLKSGDKYLFDDGCHATYKNLHLTFYKRDGELKVSVAYYTDHDGPSNPRTRPLFHTDHSVSEDELERIKKSAK